MITASPSALTSEAAADGNTRDRLLAAAETLFAEQGFESVSLRDLTHAAGTNLAAVNYHFGSKEHLIEEVLLRSLNPINEERLRLLDEAEEEAAPGPPSLEAIADAFLRPALSQVRDRQHSQMLFCKLLGRCLIDRNRDMPERAWELFREVIQRFGDALKNSHGGLAHAEALWRLNFMAGSMISTLVHGDKVVQFSGEADAPPDTDAVLRRLVAFCAQGLAAPPSAPPPCQPEKASLTGKARSLLAIGSLLLGMSSCATLPGSRLAELDLEVPGTWAATDAGRAGVDDRWIERFRDKKLSGLVDEALTQNPDLRAAAARVERARGNARLTGSDALPTVDLNFRPSRAKQNFIGFPGIGGQDGGVVSNHTNTFGLSFGLQWEIDVWGRIRAAHSADLSLLEAARAEERAARVSLAAQVARAWFTLAESQAQLDLARDTAKVYGDTAKAVEERFKAGQEQDGAASQLRLAETDVATARAAIAERQQSVDAAKRQLETLLGRYPSASLSGARLPSVPAGVPPGLPSELLQRRPDVLAAERRFASAGKRVTEARRAVFPRLSLTASGGTSTAELADLLNSDLSVWNLAGNVAQPILYAGKIQAGKDIRYAEEKESLAVLQKTVLQAFSEVETTLAAESFLASRARAIAEAERLAVEADQSARSDYQQGIGDLLTVLNAQTRVLQAKSQRILIQRLRLDNRVNLHLALGGDYQPRRPAQAGTPPSPAAASPLP